MILSRRILWTVAAIAIFTLFSFSKPSNPLKPGPPHAPARLSSTNDSVVVENSGPCKQLTCMDIYPKDRKVEGKNISLLNPAGMNDRGQIVGLCVLDEPASNYPFVREPDGKIWIFRTPSPTGQGEFTDINDSGEAVGFYRDTAKIKVGFVMNADGKWAMDIKYPSNPCPSGSPYLHTQPNGINQDGEIIGNYGCTQNPDDSIDAIFKGNGFYRSADGTFFQVKFEDATRTVAGKITDNGVIVGYYVVNDSTWIPFAAKKEDVIRPIAK
jgi:hypothetical protein